MPLLTHDTANSMQNPGKKEEKLHRHNVDAYKKFIAPYIQQVLDSIEDFKGKKSESTNV